MPEHHIRNFQNKYLAHNGMNLTKERSVDRRNFIFNNISKLIRIS